VLQYGDAEDNSKRLSVWKKETGALVDVKMVPGQSDCTFLDAERGAYLSGGANLQDKYFHLQLTLDGGRTWTRTDHLLKRGQQEEEGRRLLWLSPTELMVGGERSVALFTIHERGALRREWITDVKGGVWSMVPTRNRERSVWVKAYERAVEVDVASGRVSAVVEPGFWFNTCALVGEDLWVAGDNAVAAYRRDAQRHYRLVKTLSYPGEWTSIWMVDGRHTKQGPAGQVKWIFMDGSGTAQLIGVDGQRYSWDGKSDVLTATTMGIDDTAVEKAAIAAEAKEPTREQFGAYLSFAGKLPEERFGDVLEAASEKQAAAKWTNREMVAWMIPELERVAAEVASKPAGPPHPTGYFGGVVYDLRIFSRTSGIAVTRLGLFATDGSLANWKAVTPWPRPMWFRILGGTEKLLYLMTSENREVVVKEGFDRPKELENDFELHQVTRRGKPVLMRYDYTFTLWRWTPEKGLVEIRKLPRGMDYSSSAAPCEFVDERTGAFVDGKKLFVTRDGAKTWVESPIEVPKYSRGAYAMAFCGANCVAVTAGTEDVSMLAIGEDGRAKQLWRSKLFGRYGFGFSAMVDDAAGKLIWVHTEDVSGRGDRMEGFSLTDGSRVRQFEPFGKGENMASCRIVDGRLFGIGHLKRGGTELRIWDLSMEPPALKAQVQVYKNMMGLDGAFAVPGGEDVYLLLSRNRLIKWDGRGMVPGILPSRIEAPVIDHALFDGVEDAWPPGDFATLREQYRLIDAQRELTPQQQAQISAEADKKASDFETYRARTLWMTQRSLELGKKAGGAETRPAEKSLQK
jgi:hypothetical protein